MKTIVRSAVVLLGACAMSLFAADEVAVVGKPAHPLDKTWVVKELWEGTTQNTDEEMASFRMTFAEGKMTAKIDGEDFIAAVTLDDTKTPRWLTLKAEVEGESLTIEGIYEVNNGIFKLCHPQEPGGVRPASFEKAEGVVLLIFKHEEAAPAGAEKPIGAPAAEVDGKEKP